MIPQLVKRLQDGGMALPVAITDVLCAEPMDLVLYMEEVWDAANQLAPAPPGVPARRKLWEMGRYAGLPAPLPLAWEHIGYSYVLENTRAVQILRRVVREYRSGEGLGIPSIATQRWLDATEALLFGAAYPLSGWLSTSTIRQDPEAIRRNAYWRFFGLDLAFGNDGDGPPAFDKATAANTSFVRLFEELLFELWQAMSNVRNTSGVNASDDDRVFRLAEELQYILTSRRQQNNLAREELAAATALGWVELTLSSDTSVVQDLRAQATSAAERLRLIGERVGLAAHSQSAALFEMSADLSLVLRTLEARVVSDPRFAWVLYLDQPPTGSPPGSPSPIGAEMRRVITEWSAATGHDLKARARPIEVNRRALAPAH